MKIGIAITTHNRNAQCDKTVAQIRRFTPSDALIVVVDDASRIQYRGATYRFKKNVGTPTAKNKCMELLYNAGCDHLFLFDDDCYPCAMDWWKPYVNAGVPHLNYTFKYHKKRISDLDWCDNPNGCMMYFHRSVLDKVGGFDTGFKTYGYWHGAMSNRVYNAGMIPHPFIDVPDSDKLFVQLDRDRRISTSRPDRGRFLPGNKQRYIDKLDSSEYIEFRTSNVCRYPKIHYSNPYATDKNIGGALNEFCSMVPDGDWICLQDGDIMYLTPDWGKQISEAVMKHGDRYDLIGCMTNRLARPIQRHQGEFSNDHDIRNHYRIAKDLSEQNWAEVKDITSSRYIAGMFMLFPKTTWNKVKFIEDNIAFDDQFSKGVIRARGRLGLMTGLYVYHLYRLWSDSPVGDRKHLQ